MKNHNISYLVQKLIKAGVINARTLGGGKQTIYSWMRSGKLLLKNVPQSKYYVVNDNEIKHIIKEFSPGGKGIWKAK